MHNKIGIVKISATAKSKIMKISRNLKALLLAIRAQLLYLLAFPSWPFLIDTMTWNGRGQKRYSVTNPLYSHMHGTQGVNVF